MKRLVLRRNLRPAYKPPTLPQHRAPSLKPKRDSIHVLRANWYAARLSEVPIGALFIPADEIVVETYALTETVRLHTRNVYRARELLSMPEYTLDAEGVGGKTTDAIFHDPDMWVWLRWKDIPR